MWRGRSAVWYQFFRLGCRQVLLVGFLYEKGVYYMAAFEQCVKNLPVSLFASVMGTAGLSIDWQRYSAVFGLSAIAGIALLFLAYLCLTVVGIVYGYKFIHYRQDVIAELNHPVRAIFFCHIYRFAALGDRNEPFNRSLAEGI